ncbi:MAG: low temperature requirement protein A [Firmicutes bacterium]|nr:low temperature requirement protein A [Bacillota bacterium]
MIPQLPQAKEKKVEYIELIYDLIFVYIIGRNNALLHIFENGFVAWPAFLGYIMATLAVIQIWSYTTYYINIYGRHSVREHVFLFINMFLLYFIGEGTTADWHGFHAQYHLAWALILVNTGVQYLLELRNQRDREENRQQIFRMVFILFTEALMVLANILVYRSTSTTWLSFAAILFGIGAVLLSGQKSREKFVDFPHLSERAMLYVVFTFGEMIIAIASYFDGAFSLRSTYFALMAFLIVAGLFLSYGVFYDHIIDRDKPTNGLSYMLLHIFIIFAMNNITNGLEFMREEEIALLPKILFLTGSFLLFFGFLFVLGNLHAKTKCIRYPSFCLRAALLGLIFVLLMLLLRNNMMVNITFTVVFIFALFAMIYRYGKKVEAATDSGVCFL